MAVLGTTDITTTKVRNALGESSNDVGTLCLSDKINIWAANKPHTIIAPLANVLGGLINSHGLYRVGPDSVHYARPQGGATDPFRLGDFRGYDTLMKAPVQPTILSVKNETTGNNETSPYHFIQGFRYKITFRLLAGEIDPSTIYYKTVRTKNVDMGGGYGGIILAENSGGIASNNDDVVSCPIYTKTVNYLCDKTGSAPFHFFYCQYSGDDTGEYSILDFRSEDETYLNDISAGLIDFDTTVRTPWWDSLAGKPSSGVTVVNNTDVNFGSVRVKFEYNSTGASATTYEYMTIPANGTGTVSVLLDIGGNSGSTRYSVTATIEIYDSISGTYLFLSSGSAARVVDIPNY